MTGPDEQMLREADPYRPGAAGDLDEGARELLEQIVSEPMARTARFRFAAVGAAAAAVLVAAVAVPALWPSRPAPAPAPAAQPSATDPRPVPAGVQKAAEQGPRLLLGEPGWKVVHLEPYGERRGEMAYEKGRLRLMMMWHPTDEYDTYRLDRRANAEQVTVGGLTGWLVPFGKGDFDLITEPRDGVFADFRAQPGWTSTAFRALLAGVRQVDAPTWVASIGPLITPEGEARDRSARLLVDVPAPPRWVGPALAGDGDQFASAVARRAACSWLVEWQRAKAAAETINLNTAGVALLGSTDWQVLEDLESRGSGLRQTIVTMADRVVRQRAGEAEIQGYRTSIC